MADDEQTVLGCPECTSSQIRKRVTTQDWRCGNCEAVFDEPEERPPKKGQKKSRNPEHPATKVEQKETPTVNGPGECACCEREVDDLADSGLCFACDIAGCDPDQDCLVNTRLPGR